MSGVSSSLRPLKRTRIHVNNLPDHILSEIVGRLPLKSAVRTGLISKRWEKLWRANTDWSLSVEMFAGKIDKAAKFEQLVSQIIFLHEGPGIKVFKVHYDCYFRRSNMAPIWVEFLVKRGIRILHLDIREAMKFPMALFTCPTLVELRLCFYYDFVKLPSNVSLVNLTTMLLEHARFITADRFQKLMEGCPKLIILHLCGCVFTANIDLLTITHPILRDLQIDRCHWKEGMTLRISTPHLEFFKFKGLGLISNNIELINASPSYGAILEPEEYYDTYRAWRSVGRAEELGFLIAMIMQIMSNLRVLRFNTWCIEWLSTLLEVFADATIEYPLLMRLVMSIWPNKHHAYVAVGLLKMYPQVEELAIETIHNTHIPIAYNQGRVGYANPPNFLSTECHHVKLRIVKIYSYGGTADEKNVVKYLLKSGVAIKEFEVKFADRMTNETRQKLTEELLQYPRASPALEMSFRPLLSPCPICIS
ncbi:hypothetical protein J5N97_027218 [Dioscorea zingiberensis]|uniref:F-box domain-containing protein n=1 Tax=Dioscorea zingiberensis TaxID=325984 RepID=A0A9D5C3T2_9LILI|nr:hypothetical protein J5N97_027218 [Dioscorea zingiberensis]